jgi:hypothetical protein
MIMKRTVTHADADATDTPRIQRLRGVHDLPRRERRGGRADRVRAAVAARI